jgi:GT2 family glycosyltransferase
MATDPYYTTQQRAGAPQPTGVYDDPGYGTDEALDAFTGKFGGTEPVDPASLNRLDVTLVLVAHNGARWLPRTLDALGVLERKPDRIVGVDTGSRDDSGRLLTSALGGHSVTSASRSSGFGDAVQTGIDSADELATARGGIGQFQGGRAQGQQRDNEWIWILHDDSAPAPDALRHLLEIAVRRPDAGVIGPKVVSWSEDRQLLEVGFAVTGSGRRHTGLDRREYDQGQYDTPRDVLAVGSAGMLVRRDVWDQMQGFDPVLTLFRDDLDFCWRANQAGYAVVATPDATVYHAEASAHGKRRTGATRKRPHLADRRNAVYVMLANVSLLAFPLALVRMLLGSLARAVGFLLGKQPALAVEELIAALAVFLRPDRLVLARVRRAKTRKRTNANLRALFPPAGQQFRRGAENVMGFVSGAASHDVSGNGRRGADREDDDELPANDETLLLRVLINPAVLLITALVVTTLVAIRGLVGMGRLTGGALLPAPRSTASMWQVYTESWHGVGLGSPTESPPYLAVVAAVGSLVRNAPLALDLLLLGSVPLAGLTAYLLLRKVAPSKWLRVWGAAAYGLLPATSGAIAAGRLGTAVAAVLTPLLAMAVIHTLGRRGAPGPFRASWSAGLLLAVTAAFVPLAWVIALVLGVAAIVIFRDRATAWRVAAMLVVTPVVLLPWTSMVVDELSLLFTEAGSPGPGLSDPDLAPWAVLLQHPGGPGGAPVWLGVGLLLAAWTALLRGDRRMVIGTAWAVGLTALILGIAASQVTVSGPTLETPEAAWPGYATVVLAGALIVAAVTGADGARARLKHASFGWRQPIAVLVVAAAAITPVVGAGWWLARGADDPLDRRDARVLPAYVADEAALETRVRTLVLNAEDDGRITYSLLRSSGPMLGDAEVGPPPEKYAALSDAVADLISGRGSTDGTRLAEFAAKYVYLPKPVDPELANTLDSVSGLARASAPDGAAMWRVDGYPVARVWVAPGDVTDDADSGADSGAGAGDEVTTIISGSASAFGDVPEGDAGRLLVVSELADSGWSATLNGQSLQPTTYDGWAQAFELPQGGGLVRVDHQAEQRQNWLKFQLAVVAVALVLAAPGMRRQRGAIDAAAELDPEDTDPGRIAQPVQQRQVVASDSRPVRNEQVWPGAHGGSPPPSVHSGEETTRPIAQPEQGPPLAGRDDALPRANDARPSGDDALPGGTGASPGDGRSRRQGGRRRKKGGSPKVARPRSSDGSRGGKRAAGKRAKGRRRDGGEH